MCVIDIYQFDLAVSIFIQILHYQLTCVYYISLLMVQMLQSVCSFLAGKISKKSCIQWYSYYRDLMTTYLARNPVQFRNMVHVDETAVGGKRKYNRGNNERGETCWLFGSLMISPMQA